MRSTNRCLPASTARFLHWLTTHGRPGSRKLKGYKDHWRIRAGDWRVLYIVDAAAKSVSITRIAHRREVYE